MRKYLAFLVLGVLAFGSTPLQAAPIHWVLDHEFSGGTPPDGTLAVDLVQTVAGTVRLTVDASLLVGGEFVGELLLNVDPTASISITDLVGPGFYTVGISQAQNTYKADGDGKFDIELAFGNAGADRLSAGEKATFDISGTDLVPESFLFLSDPAGGHGPFYVAAHVGGIGPGGQYSGWVTDQPNGEVPEASTLMLLGSGLPGLALWARSRRRRG